VNLVDFLLARIAEDEELARSVQQRHAFLEPYAPAVPGRGLEWDDHMVYAPPLRVLAECDAKRAIINTLDGVTAAAADTPGVIESAVYRGMARAMEEAVRMVAAVYGDHPDYREEWRA
jgi:hypothetical protein